MSSQSCWAVSCCWPFTSLACQWLLASAAAHTYIHTRFEVPVLRLYPSCCCICSYAFPSLIKVMPAPLLQAARATVDSGRAARQWIEQSKSRKEA